MIYEDPDELGYSTDPAGNKPFSVALSLAECNAILPRAQQNAIENAARYAYVGHQSLPQMYRAQAGYDRLPGGFKGVGPLYGPKLPPPHGGYPNA